MAKTNHKPEGSRRFAAAQGSAVVRVSKGTYRAKCRKCGWLQIQLDAVAFDCVKCGDNSWDRPGGVESAHLGRRADPPNDKAQRPALKTRSVNYE